MASATEKSESAAKSFARRDLLLRIQNEAQKKWEQGKVFEANAREAKPAQRERYFGNFPYPYMNGLLHLGHAFTLSKVEFASAYHRLRGANVLFPFGFHCTGMPIKACADKLAREIEKFGCPPSFPKENEASEPQAKPHEDSTVAAQAVSTLSLGEERSENSTSSGEASKQQGAGEKDPAKFKGKKSKAAAKTGPAKYQWQIMSSMGISDEEIRRFAHTDYWLEYFPPLAMSDLQAFGLGVDWRRSFITTDLNPYYDSFARWHLQTLKDKGKVVKDRRYTIFSPHDRQPCADHDRASGEGVLPQEYTLIKIKVIPPFNGKLQALSDKCTHIYLVAATLRPETMYGQTNVWVLPDGEYGCYKINSSEIFVTAHRAALNLSYQFLSPEFGKPECLLTVTGRDLIGLPLEAPLALNPKIYALPMLTILMDKGTGVVTSVPSDSPDDYMALHDLRTKPALRAKFNVQDEHVLPFDVIPIINIPEFGDKSAEVVCKQLKIQSQNDKEKLAEAKKMTYLKGFTDGVMLVGELSGTKVQDAKPQIKKMLVDRGEAVLYSEPESKVMSRSGDECVVALTDQWYLTYGEDDWKALSQKCLDSMNLFHEETRNGFKHTLGWLDRWACSRSFGLGTRIPWDPEFLIESLSDSTIYMAYYTVAHLLQQGNIFGKGEKPTVPAEQLTKEFWDYLFLDGERPKGEGWDQEFLTRAKSEFEYWYPFDLRVSGKDLINNHLTFSIYNHTAIFKEECWPRGFRCNGHLLLNAEKMSKSTGNFKTLRQAIDEFSSDATRFALADAGDTVDDANFVEDTANAAILRLTKELTWMEEVLSSVQSLRCTEPEQWTFADKVFSNEINIAVSLTEENFEKLNFREALKAGFYDLQLARDEYRFSCGVQGMDRSLLLRFLEVQTLLLMPICPHYGEHVWSNILKKEGFGITAGFPKAENPDYNLQRANKYLQDIIVDFRKILTKQQSVASGKGGKANKKGGAQPAAQASQEPPKIRKCLVFVAEKYGGWQEECLKLLRKHFDPNTKGFHPDSEIMAALRSGPISQLPEFKKLMSLCMGFIKFRKDMAVQMGEQALDLRLSFDEIAVLKENVEIIKRQLGLEEFSIFSLDSTKEDAELMQAIGKDNATRILTALPGAPVPVYLP